MLFIYFKGKKNRKWTFQLREPASILCNAYRFCYNKEIGKEAIIIESRIVLPREIDGKFIKKMEKIGRGLFLYRES